MDSKTFESILKRRRRTGQHRNIKADMRDALTTVMKSSPDQWAKFKQLSVVCEMSDDTHINWMAYRIRAMMSHIRKRFDGGAKDCS